MAEHTHSHTCTHVHWSLRGVEFLFSCVYNINLLHMECTLSVWSLHHFVEFYIKLKKHSLKIHFLFWSVCRCYNWPLLCVKDGKGMLAGHEALFYVSHLQVVQRKHVFLLFFLDNETDNGHLKSYWATYLDSMPRLLFSIQTWQSFEKQSIKILIRFSTVLTNCIRSF